MVEKVPVDESGRQTDTQDSILGKIDDVETWIDGHVASGWGHDLAIKALEMLRHVVQRHPPT